MMKIKNNGDSKSSHSLSSSVLGQNANLGVNQTLKVQGLIDVWLKSAVYGSDL